VVAPITASTKCEISLAARVLLARSWTMFRGVSAWWRGANVSSPSVGNEFRDGDTHVPAGADADVRSERDEDIAAAVADGIGAGRGFDRATAAGIDDRLSSSSSSSSSSSASSSSNDDDVATLPVALPGVSPEDDVAAPPVALREDDDAAEGGDKCSYAKTALCVPEFFKCHQADRGGALEYKPYHPSTLYSYRIPLGIYKYIV
jgi:hypothetical protein